MSIAVIVSAAIGICFGGLAGALLTNFLTYYRARPQSVGYRVEVVTLAPQLEKWQFHARINIQNREGTLVGVDRLDLVRIEVTNQGNRDMPGFGFGVTLPPRIVILDTKLISPDRHHSIEQEKHRALPNDGVPDTKVVLGSLEGVKNFLVTLVSVKRVDRPGSTVWDAAATVVASRQLPSGRMGPLGAIGGGTIAPPPAHARRTPHFWQLRVPNTL